MKFCDEEGILHTVEVERSQKMKINEQKIKNMKSLRKFLNRSKMGKCQAFIFYSYQIKGKENRSVSG
ncbi:hypothetical protein bcere0020_54390 [Bacillus cereus Rock3-29]|nr:hypothetical protein bcere0020_54390 [Bacillus cereus Rock3-29]